MNIIAKYTASGILGVVVGLLLTFHYAANTLPATAVENTTPTAATEEAAAKAVSSATIDIIYPLFAEGISWSPKIPVSLPPRSNYNPTNQTIAGYQVTSLPTASTEDIGATVEPMRNYYNDLLLQQGWRIDINFQADGPGGSVWGFRKGSSVLIFSYTSTFFNNQPDVPAQCPCTVVFTIIGGTLE